MKKYILIISVFLFSGINEMKSQTFEIAYQDFEWECNFNSNSGNFIISNLIQLNEISDCNLPGFDFEKYTIIGVQGQNNGHDTPVVELKIIKDDINKKVIVDAVIFGGKSCNCRVMKPSFKKIIYIDKLPKDYKIEFKKEMIND